MKAYFHSFLRGEAGACRAGDYEEVGRAWREVWARVHDLETQLPRVNKVKRLAVLNSAPRLSSMCHKLVYGSYALRGNDD